MSSVVSTFSANDGVPRNCETTQPGNDRLFLLLPQRVRAHGQIVNRTNQQVRYENRPHVVLVVEDEILVRSMVAEFLRQAGYTVVEASNAAEAVEIFRTGITINLVFSDITMPGPDAMDGIGLARWIVQHRPAVDVILTSGDRDDAHAVEAAGFLRKPYRLTEAICRIRALLENQQAER